MIIENIGILGFIFEFSFAKIKLYNTVLPMNLNSRLRYQLQFFLLLASYDRNRIGKILVFEVDILKIQKKGCLFIGKLSIYYDNDTNISIYIYTCTID